MGQWGHLRLEWTLNAMIGVLIRRLCGDREWSDASTTQGTSHLGVTSGGCPGSWHLEQRIGQNTHTKQGKNEATKAAECGGSSL